jgi:hypothetical protein
VFAMFSFSPINAQNVCSAPNRCIGANVSKL